MARMRVVADNAADRCTITTSTTAGALAAGRMQTDDKTEVARSTGTSWTITGTTAVTEQASCVHLLGNLSPTATIRARFYSDTAGTALVLDTNTLQPGALACPAPARVPRGWSAAHAASAYFNGGGSYGRIWHATVSFKKFVIDIVDTDNQQGYLEAYRLVVATHWEPEYNSTGVSVRPVDSTTLYRNAAGGQGGDAGHIHRVLPLDLGLLRSADRTIFMNLLMNSRVYPILISQFPAHSDLALERDHSVYGRRPVDSDIAYQFTSAFSSKVEIEEI